jgi:hypothetical protein
MLIMQQIPPKIRKTVQDILVIHSALSIWYPETIAGVLNLSEEQVRRSCASIQSVMELQGSNLESMRFHFYHASFLDFLQDPTRSTELYILGDPLAELRRERLSWLHYVCSHSTGNVSPSHPIILCSDQVLLYA